MDYDKYGEYFSRYNYSFVTKEECDAVIDAKTMVKQVQAQGTYLKCMKCQSNLIIIECKQVRGGDEGQTMFCKCSTCGHRWTGN